MKRSARIIRLISLVCVALMVCSVATACPTCKEGLAQNDPHHDAMVQGYFWSILFMMSMPFLIFGGWAGYIYLAVRKARQGAPAATGLPAGLASPPLTPMTSSIS